MTFMILRVFYIHEYSLCLCHASSQPVAAMVVLCWHSHPARDRAVPEHVQREAFGLTACGLLTA